jgi:glutathionylspermidine synthase
LGWLKVQRIALDERPDWRQKAEALGFQFHTIDGTPYWIDDAYYRFTLAQIERDLEEPSAELHDMALDLVSEVIGSEALMDRLAVPNAYRDWIAQSFRKADLHLYGRMDLAYDGHGPAKLLELNYDTPTSLYEAAYFQWLWLEERITRGDLPKNADQYNAIQDQLIAALHVLRERMNGETLHLSSVRGHVEDRGTVQYLRDCAAHAGLDTQLIDLEDIGLSADGRYTDLDDRVIQTLFKLYPLEDLLREAFAPALPASGLQIIEPPWKLILSNKGVLPLLWERHRGHPNLLEAQFEEPEPAALAPGWVRKPLHSREGANVAVMAPDGATQHVDGPYADGPSIRQAYVALPRFDDWHAVIGAWLIADRAAGIGIREDSGLITRDSARFVPHAIVD